MYTAIISSNVRVHFQSAVALADWFARQPHLEFEIVHNPVFSQN